NIGSGRAPHDQIAQGCEEIVRTVLRERGVGAKSQSFSARCRGDVDDGARGVGRAVDPVCTSAGQYDGRSSSGSIDDRQRAQRKLLIAAASAATVHAHGRFTRGNDTRALLYAS